MQRAVELMERFHEEGALTRMAFPEILERAFKEYARDQRHACAEAVMALETATALGGTAAIQYGDAACAMQYDAHSAVVNTPFPGEGE